MLTLSERVRHRMTEHQLSNDTLAECALIDTPHLQRLLDGEERWRAELIAAVARALGCPPEDLVRGTDCARSWQLMGMGSAMQELRRLRRELFMARERIEVLEDALVHAEQERRSAEGVRSRAIDELGQLKSLLETRLALAHQRASPSHENRVWRLENDALKSELAMLREEFKRFEQRLHRQAA